MKILSGAIEIAQESISDMLLMKAGIDDPDFIPSIMRAYPTSSPLNYILDLKKMKTKGLSMDTNTHRFRSVSSNHVKYRLDEDDLEIRHFKSNHLGVTFSCPAFPDKPGYMQSPIYVYSDTNWDGFQEVIELDDNITQLINLTDPEEESDGVWKHTYKIMASENDEYIHDLSVFDEGAEYVVRYNAHEQDFSERGVEKYSFKVWSDAYLTLQRFKYSWSGTAAAKLNSKKRVKGVFVENNGERSFLTMAEHEMMKRATKQLNGQYIFGKQTVSAETGKVILKNFKNREIMAGNGIFFSNGGPVYIPFNGWTDAFLEYMMSEISTYILPDANGKMEVVMLMAQKSFSSFMSLMRKKGVTQNNNIEGTGAEKGINDTYSYYELGGVRLIAFLEPTLVRRARKTSPDGTHLNDYDTILVPLGQTEKGNNGVELIQLRPMSKGTVAGIDEGGNISSSVDGSSTHVLFQNGVINQNRIFMLRKPALIA